MSPDLERVIGRAVTDKAFRDQLLADPEGTVKGAGLSLSGPEMDDLKAGINKAKSTSTTQQIDQRFGLGPLAGWG